MKPLSALTPRGSSQARAEEEPSAQEKVRAERRTSCWRERQTHTFYTSNASSVKETPRPQLAVQTGCTWGAIRPCLPVRPALRASSSTRHSPEHQAAEGCKTAAASQPGETHNSEVVRLLPRVCTLLSIPPGREVFQKQKVILLQSRRGRFRQPTGKMSSTTSSTAAENKVSPKDCKSSR